MKRFYLFVLAVFLVTVFTGCGIDNWSRENNFGGEQKPAIGTIEHSNSSIKMDVVDEIPSLGIIVVRFIDGGHTRYIAVNKDSTTTISTTRETRGKGVVFYEGESISVKR